MLVKKSITIRNFLSYGDKPQTIQLNKSGKNLVHGSNGFGKSSIENAVRWCLYGKIGRDITKSSIPNRTNKKNCVVELTATKGNNNIRIVRGIAPSVFEIYVDDRMIEQSSHTKDYQKLLETDILEMTYQMYNQIESLSEDNYQPFFKLSATQRRTFVETILDISSFTDMSKILKEELKGLKSDLISNTSLITTYQTTIDANQSIIDKIKAKDQDAELIKIQTIQDLNNQIEENGYDKSKHEALTQTLDQYKDLILREVEKISKCNLFLQHLNEKGSKLKENLNSLEQDSICLACGSIPDNIEGHKIDIQVELADLRSEFAKVHKEMSKIEQSKLEFSKVYQEKLSYNNQLNQKYQTYNALMLKLENIKNQDNSQVDCTDLEENISDLTDKVKNLSDINVKIKQDIVYRELAIELTSDKGIKSDVIDMYIPLLNQFVNFYLSKFNLFYSFEMDSSFACKFKKGHRVECEYGSLSKGQRFRVDFAVVLAWRDLCCMKTGSDSNCFFMDDILGPLDAEGVNDVISVMQELDPSLSIFMFTHEKEKYKEYFDSSIECCYDGNFTNLKFS